MDTSDIRRATDALLSFPPSHLCYQNFSVTVRNAVGSMPLLHAGFRWCGSEVDPAVRCPSPTPLLSPLLLLLLSLSAAALAGPPGGVDESGAPAGPSFPGGQRTQLSAAVGSTARLDCAILALGGCAVSWIRVRDVMILAHSGAVFASDSRLDVAVETSADGVTRHQLSISNARPSDTGRYECQLNTNPKRSLFFHLNVYEKKEGVVSTLIKGSEVRSVRLGEKFSLECEAREESGDGSDTGSDVAIRWLHEGQPLTPEAGGGLWLETQRWPRRATSKLTVGRVAESDAGRYTCAAGDDTAAHVHLRIRSESEDNGERTEAMQRDQEPATTDEAARPVGPSLGPLLLVMVMMASAVRAA